LKEAIVQYFTKETARNAMSQIHHLMEANRDYLIELDSKIGDSDLGLTMVRGFAAASETACSSDDWDIGTMFKMIGFAITKAAPSTMGTLIGSAFIGAGKTLAGREQLDADGIALCFRGMAESAASRGKSAEGEKTMLDVLFPVARAIEASNSPDITERMQVAVEQAKKSLDNTKNLQSLHGRASVFREKTIGLIDPGAAAACLVVEGFGKSCGV
jgi:phosphoenolpyruvate---glycerone phosphotransferase subunit DhaL